MEKDLNNYPPFMDFGMPGYMPGNGMNSSGMDDSILNPMMQYEQACSYYRYLSMQMDYKIKCKEYEKLCNTQK